MNLWIDALNIVLILGVLTGSYFARKLFTRGGKYYTPGRARTFWIAFATLAVVVIGYLIYRLVVAIQS